MKAADKQRILTTPTVHGEIRIKVKGDSNTYPFACLYESNASGKYCLMIGYRQDTYINARRELQKGITLWEPGFAGENLEQKVKYSEVEILWCRYDGLMSKEEFNQN